MRRTTVVLALLTLAAWLPAASAQQAAKPAEAKKIQALMITGDDVAPAHDWREIADATRKAIEDAGRVEVRVCEDPLILESATALQAYDVVVFLMYNRAVPTITGEAQENLLNFVKGGKGFYVQHLASASFKEWPEFGKLCGRHWVMGTSGHGPRAPFKAEVVDREHPITKGMADFEADDELYAKLQGDGPIHVLVKADSPWSKQTEPLVFTSEYGKGRVVQNAFGHDAKAILDPNVAKTIARGVEFAATGAVK